MLRQRRDRLPNPACPRARWKSASSARRPASSASPRSRSAATIALACSSSTSGHSSRISMYRMR
eukprot:14953664-Heterocapsa_arctica.AAC.1